MSDVVTKVTLAVPFAFEDEGRTHHFAAGAQFMPFRMAEAAHAAGVVAGAAPEATPAFAAPEAEPEADAPPARPKRTRKPKA